MSAGNYPTGMSRSDWAHVNGEDMDEVDGAIDCDVCGQGIYESESFKEADGIIECRECLAGSISDRLSAKYTVIYAGESEDGGSLFKVTNRRK